MSLFVVNVRWVKSRPDPQAIDKRLVTDQIEDWLRYNAHTWFVVTNKSSEGVRDVFRAAMSTDDSVLVLQVDANTVAGWAPNLTWDFFKKYVSGNLISR